MKTEEKPKDNQNNSGVGLILLLFSGGCFYFAWQIFQSAEKMSINNLETCAGQAKGLGQETLSYYGQCVEALGGTSTTPIGFWVLIIAGIIFGIAALYNFANK